MWKNFLLHWFGYEARSERSTKVPYKLMLEALEDRTAPAIVWDGGGNDNNFSTDENWVGDVEPGANAEIEFNNTSNKAATVDAAFQGTVKSITVGNGYFNAITLSRDLTISGVGATSRLGSGAITGTGALTIGGGTFDWFGGTIQGAGARTINAGAVMNLFYNPILDGATLVNNGEVKWNDADIIRLENGAVFDNRGTFSVMVGGGTITGAGNARFQNSATGSYVHQAASGSTARTIMQVSFVNDGFVNLQKGRLQLQAGGSSAGFFDLAAGSRFEINRLGFTYTFNGGHIDGGGSFQFMMGEVVVAADTDFNSITQWASTVLTGAGILRVRPNYTFDWEGGVWSGSGTNLIADGATLRIRSVFDGSTYTMDQRTLKNEGKVYWETDDITLQNGAKILNAGPLLTGLFEIKSDKQLINGAGANEFRNDTGTLMKSAGTGTTTIGVTFTNSSTFELNAGTVKFTNTAKQLAGSTKLASGILETNTGANDFYEVAGGIFFGGFNEVVQGNLKVSGDASTGGKVYAGGDGFVGTLTIQMINGLGGNFIIAGGTVAFDVQGVAMNPLVDRINVTGAVTFQGTPKLKVHTTLTPPVMPGTLFTLMTYPAKVGNDFTIFEYTGTINNYTPIAGAQSYQIRV